MFESFSKQRASATALLAALSLLLTGCFVTPGKFTSELVLNDDNSFVFSYRGEVFFLGLSQLAMMGEGSQEFEPTNCYDDEDWADRDCTAEEIAEQRAEWDAGAEFRKLEQEQKAKQIAAMMGGIDPTDPEAGNELARKLQRQRGWNTVEYAGNGLFNVDYAITGQLSHDIVFPVIEGVPVPSPFVQVILRDDNQVRVNAPAFAAQEAGGAGMGMLTGMASGMGGAMLAGSASENSGNDDSSNNPFSGLTVIDGTFSIVTDGHILANNTDEGPSVTTSGQQRLSWKVDTSTKAAPTALVRLGR